jgi:hypothetical protein
MTAQEKTSVANKIKTRQIEPVENKPQSKTGVACNVDGGLRFLGDIGLNELSRLLDDPKINATFISAYVACTISSEMGKYVSETQTPLLSEFCANYGYLDEIVKGLSRQDERLRLTLMALEGKKRSSLERRIYEGELNATIGAHLLKSWREEETGNGGHKAEIR